MQWNKCGKEGWRANCSLRFGCDPGQGRGRTSHFFGGQDQDHRFCNVARTISVKAHAHLTYQDDLVNLLTNMIVGRLPWASSA